MNRRGALGALVGAATSWFVPKTAVASESAKFPAYLEPGLRLPLHQKWAGGPGVWWRVESMTYSPDENGLHTIKASKQVAVTEPVIDPNDGYAKIRLADGVDVQVRVTREVMLLPEDELLRRLTLGWDGVVDQIARLAAGMHA